MTVRSWGFAQLVLKGEKGVVKHNLLIEFCTDLAWEGMVRVKRETEKNLKTTKGYQVR